MTELGRFERTDADQQWTLATWAGPLPDDPAVITGTIAARTGWEPLVSPDLRPEPPIDRELLLLRALDPEGTYR